MGQSQVHKGLAHFCKDCLNLSPTFEYPDDEDSLEDASASSLRDTTHSIEQTLLP